jgi:hypothetical protein
LEGEVSFLGLNENFSFKRSMEKVNMAVIFSSLKCLDGVFDILCLVLGNLAPLVYTPLSYPTEDFLP